MLSGPDGVGQRMDCPLPLSEMLPSIVPLFVGTKTVETFKLHYSLTLSSPQLLISNKIRPLQILLPVRASTMIMQVEACVRVHACI